MYDGLPSNLGIAKIRIFVLASAPLGEFLSESGHCFGVKTTQESTHFDLTPKVTAESLGNNNKWSLRRDEASVRPAIQNGKSVFRIPHRNTCR